MFNDIKDTISIRIDKKQFINQLKAMHDNYIELWIQPKNLKVVILKDKTCQLYAQTKN